MIVEKYDELRQKVVESLGWEEAERIERMAKEYVAKFRKRFIYKLTPLATEAALKKYFFAQEPSGFIRGEDMGWAHKVNWQTKTIEFCDPEYAQKYEENCGGLKAFLGDLIDAGLVVQEEEKEKKLFKVKWSMVCNDGSFSLAEDCYEATTKEEAVQKFKQERDFLIKKKVQMKIISVNECKPNGDTLEETKKEIYALAGLKGKRK